MRWFALILILTSTAYGQSSEDQSTASVTQIADAETAGRAVTSSNWSTSGTPAISLKAGQKLTIPAEGATAAYPVDALYVDVSLNGDSLVVEGKFAGHTEIIIVSDGNVRNLPVNVTPAATIYPPGFILPESTAAGPVTGNYEFSYISQQPQIQNALDVTTQGPDRSTQFHMLVSTMLAPQAGEGHLLLPSAFYDMKMPGWNLTLLDQSVTNSPLTVDGAVLRGGHFKYKRWIFHAGYASLASFNNFLFPVQPEGAVGASYAIPLSPFSTLTTNAYYFFAPNQTLTTARAGAVPSVVYEYKRESGAFPVQRDGELDFLAELGAGSGLGSAVRIRYSTNSNDFIVNFREKPSSFHSLSFDNVPGSESELTWNRHVSPALFNRIDFSDNRLLLPQSQQDNLTSSENLHATLSKSWSAGTGVTYANFSQTGAAGAYSIASLILPENINFDRPHFGVGFQYQYSRNSQGFAAGQDFRPNFRASFGSFSASAYLERQTQAATLESIFSDNPTLQAELNALGLTASTPEQLQSLLQQTTFLQALGLSPGAQLNLVPLQDQVGLNLNWTSSHSAGQQLNLGAVYTTDKSVLATSNNWDFTGAYVRRVGRLYNLSVSASLLRVTVGGQPQSYPLVQVGLGRTFSALPSFLSGHKFGTISGNVFQDDEGRGIFRRGLPPLAGVEVVLDGSQRTTTDNKGFYSFTHVPDGGHFIEFNFQSSRPFWFTAPSRRNATINIPANLGIRFASAELVGYIRNDAGMGIAGAQIEVAGANQHVDVQSDAQGRFSVPGLGAGDYDVTVDANSLPPGYFLEDLKPQQITLDDGLPKRIDFQLRALRSLTGRITRYDVSLGQYVPAAGVTVELRGMSRIAITNSSGMVNFRDLPSGNFTIALKWNGAEVVKDVVLPTGPGNTTVEIRLPAPTQLAIIDGDK